MEISENCRCGQKATHIALEIFSEQDDVEVFGDFYVAAMCWECLDYEVWETGFHWYTRDEAIRLIQEAETEKAERKRMEALGSGPESRGRFSLGPLFKKELCPRDKA